MSCSVFFSLFKITAKPINAGTASSEFDEFVTQTEPIVSTLVPSGDEEKLCVFLRKKTKKKTLSARSTSLQLSVWPVAFKTSGVRSRILFVFVFPRLIPELKTEYRIQERPNRRRRSQSLISLILCDWRTRGRAIGRIFDRQYLNRTERRSVSDFVHKKQYC